MRMGPLIVLLALAVGVPGTLFCADDPEPVVTDTDVVAQNPTDRVEVETIDNGEGSAPGMATVQYDGQNRLVVYIDQRGRLTTYGHDSLGRVASVLLSGERRYAITYQSAQVTAPIIAIVDQTGAAVELPAGTILWQGRSLVAAGVLTPAPVIIPDPKDVP